MEELNSLGRNIECSSCNSQLFLLHSVSVIVVANSCRNCGALFCLEVIVFGMVAKEPIVDYNSLCRNKEGSSCNSQLFLLHSVSTIVVANSYKNCGAFLSLEDIVLEMVAKEPIVDRPSLCGECRLHYMYNHVNSLLAM